MPENFPGMAKGRDHVRQRGRSEVGWPRHFDGAPKSCPGRQENHHHAMPIKALIWINQVFYWLKNAKKSIK